MQPTDPNKFTDKAWEAIAHTPDIAKQAQQQQIESEHLFKALLDQEGLANSIFTKLGTSIQGLRDYTDNFLGRQPKVSGSNSSVYLGSSLDKLLDRAEQHRKSFEDDYISIEHLLLSYAKDDRFGRGLLKEFNITEDRLKHTIIQILFAILILLLFYLLHSYCFYN